MRKRGFLKELWIPLVCGFMVLVLFRFAFFLGYVPTESMEPTLSKNSCFLAIRLYTELNVGDIVVFKHGGRLLVKRIAAGPGDTIVHKRTVLTVPNGYFYMLGDNAEASYDARYWDDPFVSADQVVARVLLV